MKRDDLNIQKNFSDSDHNSYYHRITAGPTERPNNKTLRSLHFPLEEKKIRNWFLNPLFITFCGANICSNNLMNSAVLRKKN